MGLFSFLGDHTEARPGATVQGKVALNPSMNPAFANGMAERMGDPGLLQKAPVQVEQPGFLHNLIDYAKRPETMLALGTALRSSGGNEGAFADQARIIQGQRADKLLERAQADRARKNAAFKAAYQNGKFDPAAYTSALGDSSVDPSDIADLTRAFSPKAGVDGGYSYTQDPTTGETHWGGQRPESYGEQAAIAREAEQERRNQQLEDIARQGLKIREFSAHRPRVGHGGSASGLPPGYVAR
jgi:hypothetical protein